MSESQILKEIYEIGAGTSEKRQAICAICQKTVKLTQYDDACEIRGHFS